MMARIPPDQIQKEIDQQNDDVYGDDFVDGDHDEFADTEEMVKEVIGNKPDKGESFSIADEVEDDEEDIRGLGDDDDNTEQEEEEELLGSL